jgi:hypothetical protein
VWGSDEAGARRLWRLIQTLPRDSAFVAKVDPDTALWGPLEQLTAVHIEAFVNANRGPKDRSKPPWKFPGRPVPSAPTRSRPAGARVIDPFSPDANLSGSVVS